MIGGVVLKAPLKAPMQETNMMGAVKENGKIWYHPHPLANIMSIANVRKNLKSIFQQDRMTQNPRFRYLGLMESLCL